MSLIRAIEKENEKEAKELIFQSIGLNHKNKVRILFFYGLL